jgi:DNA-binding FrmR family transcriptional regulator
MAKHDLHETHGDVLNRLKRAEGHLATVIRMVDDGRDCLDLAQQLHAVEKAIAQAKKTLIHDHIDHCLEHSASADAAVARQSIREFKAITKYL